MYEAQLEINRDNGDLEVLQSSNKARLLKFYLRAKCGERLNLNIRHTPETFESVSDPIIIWRLLS